MNVATPEPSGPVRKRGPMPSLQIGRGVAAVVIVLFHANVVVGLPKYWDTELFGGFFLPANSAVYFFFVLSGFVMAHAHDGHEEGRLAALKYVKHRVLRIYPLYWAVTGLVVFAYYAVGVGEYSADGMAYFLGVVTLLPFDGEKAYLAVAWMLFHQTIFYIFFAIIVLSRTIGSLIFWAWGFFCALVLVFGIKGNFAGVALAPINLLFFFGYVARLIDYPRDSWRRAFVGWGGFAVFAIVWGVQVNHHSSGRTATAFFVFGVASAMMIWAAAPLTFKSNRSRCVVRMLSKLGDASYSIYLVHFLALSFMAKVFFKVFAFFPTFVCFALLVVLATGCGYLVFIFVERPLGRLLRGNASMRVSASND